jgi:hypothetical protein
MAVLSQKIIRLGKEPVVVLPLKKWQEMEELFEDMEDALRFNQAISDPKNQKLIPLAEVKKKFKLQNRRFEKSRY